MSDEITAMSDARLEQLAGLAELPCSCNDADCGNYTSALTAVETRELLAEVKRARTELAKLRPEYGVRVRYTSTRIREQAVSDNADDAREQATKVAQNRNVVSAVPLRRSVGEWEELEKGDDRG